MVDYRPTAERQSWCENAVHITVGYVREVIKHLIAYSGWQNDCVPEFHRW
ncbi:hypothetical protein LINGRAHAP2_LOCUS23028, partial [Linum grandiflorum]